MLSISPLKLLPHWICFARHQYLQPASCAYALAWHRITCAIDLLGYPRKSMASQLQYFYFQYYHFYSPCAALECSIRSLRLVIRFNHEPVAQQHEVADALLKRYRSVYPGQSVSTCSGRIVPKIVSR